MNAVAMSGTGPADTVKVIKPFCSRQRIVTLQGCSPTVKDRDGCTPLYCAAAWNRMEAVRKLASLGSQAGVRSSEGRTPVHVAAEQVQSPC